MVNTYLDNIKLPINPLEEVSFSVSGDNKTFSVVNLGEISELGNRKQITISIKSLFVNSDCFTFKKGNYVNSILTIIDSKKPIRFIIAGDGFDTNLLVNIDTFKYSIPYGENGDTYYSLSLKEYREHKSKSLILKTAYIDSSISSLSNSNDFISKREDVEKNA